MGDWAQGEFAVAEQVAGEDYSCLPGLGVNRSCRLVVCVLLPEEQGRRRDCSPA